MSTVGETTASRWVRGRNGRSLRRSATGPGLGGRLHALVGRPDVQSQTSSLTAALQERLRAAAGAESSAVWVRSADGELDLVAAHGPQTPSSEGAVRRCLTLGRASWRDETLALPLRIGTEVFGVVALSPARLPDPGRVPELQATADDYAVRLDTAIFADEVRSSATSEERRRVAREIHDGVAQRIVALGYLADDVAVLAKDAVSRQAVESLRDEITRIAGELRLSVLDLRSDPDLEGGISEALTAYAGELGRRTDLRVHLHLDERGPRQPREVEREMLRIGLEAINNVHQHAHAINLWVTFTADGHQTRLVVEDDGIGRTSPRAGHYGLQGMRERAERIDAALEIGVRPDGGTVVTVQTRATTAPTTEGDSHGHHRLARR